MATIRDYASASDYLKGKADRPLPGRATRIIRRDADTMAIRYQATDVVTYHADGRIVFNSGGWNTVTMRARFNEYSHLHFWTERGIMYAAKGYPDWADKTRAGNAF